MEISELRSRNRELTTFIFEALRPNRNEEESSDEAPEDLEPLGHPIETNLQRRRRLEADSLRQWNEMVQKAKEEMEKPSTSKPIDELEKDILGVMN